MRWVVIAISGLFGLVVVVAAVGSFLPKAHVARRSAVFARPPERVWGVITDFAGAAAWRTDLRAVEKAPDRNGHEVWLELPKSGSPLPLETREIDAPRRLVRTIADPSLPFGGRWIYELEPSPGGSRLTITEEGDVRNPVFRFVSHFFMDPSATIDAYLRSLSAHFGEEPRLEPA